MQLATRKFKTFYPLLLTDLRLGQKQTKDKNLAQLEISSPFQTTRAELEALYNVVYGEFDDEGNWNCELTFHSPGPFFCQIVFVPNLEPLEGKFTIKGSLC